MACRVCSSARRTEIEAALRTKAVADVADAFGLTELGVQRHVDQRHRPSNPSSVVKVWRGETRVSLSDLASLMHGDEEPPATSRSGELPEISTASPTDRLIAAVDRLRVALESWSPSRG